MKTVAILSSVLLMLSPLAVSAAEVELQEVESSFLGKTGYDVETKTFFVQMKNSSDVYAYKAVPPEVAKGFQKADSKGGYYVKKIKGHYEVERR